MKSIVLYLHVHQPFRIRHYTIFDAGQHHDYFDAPYDAKESNEAVIRKVAEKSYLPTNKVLLELLEKHPGFKLSLSITGTIMEQLEEWAPDVLDSFRALTDTGRVEIVAETYHHSLAFFYSRQEFSRQVELHAHKVKEIFGQTPKVFRNTELAYNNELGSWAEEAGYLGVLAEGWDPVLGWRSPNFVYRPPGTEHVRLLLKNYKLSDDIAFRFGNRAWEEWPLSADKYAHWLSESGDATNFNLFMDYETFGEHQWEDTGIFDFLRHLPEHWLADDSHDFKTVSEVIEAYEPVDVVDMPYTVTWADTERDLTAWLGNKMQHEASQAIYDLEEAVFKSHDPLLVADWRKLTTSDHFYYMCTKWFSDGDVHAYFSPYDTPYEAFINFMNAWHDLRYRLIKKGIEI
jgi:alpha-amylase